MTTLLDRWIEPAEREALLRPIEHARGLPGRLYGADFYAVEQRALFPRTWAAVGFGCDVPDPGDTMPLELAGYPLLLVRQPDATLRVFHNQCRHRGMALVQAPRAAQRSLTCPWHGWSYGLDGRLRATTNLGGEGEHRCPGFEAGELGLLEVRSACWNDLVFVNLDGRAPPFASHIAPLVALLDGYETDGLRLSTAWEHHYAGNWKLAIEGGIEDYHLPLAHPQLFDGIGKRPVAIATGPAYAATVGLPERHEPPPEPPGGRLLATTDAQRGRSYVINLYPTGIVLLNGSALLLALFTPDGPARTRLVFRQYTHAANFGTPALDAWRDRRRENLIRLVQQDDAYVERVHHATGMRDAIGLQTRFSPYWEGAVLHFQRMVLATLADASAEG